jgi:hypothetical protein
MEPGILDVTPVLAESAAISVFNLSPKDREVESINATADTGHTTEVRQSAVNL